MAADKTSMEEWEDLMVKVPFGTIIQKRKWKKTYDYQSCSRNFTRKNGKVPGNK